MIDQFFLVMSERELIIRMTIPFVVFLAGMAWAFWSLWRIDK